MKITRYAICDDIRFEKDNKISLMGLYEDKIIFNVDPQNKDKWPKPFSFGVVIRLQIEKKDIKAGLHSIEISLIVSGEKQRIANFEIQKEHLQPGRKIGLMPKIGNFPIKSEGELSLEVNLLTKDGHQIAALETEKTELLENVVDATLSEQIVL